MKISEDQLICLNGQEYKIKEKINIGGNGVVWLAIRIVDLQEFAIKFLKSTRKPDRIERFKKEIEFCYSCSHPNIIKISDYGEYEGEQFYVMPKYPYTLRDIIDTNYNPSQLLKYLIDLCKAIKFIHNNSIIHRDIKPENILVDELSNLVLADFGIAHFMDFSITKPGDLVANRSYASPEQKIKGYADKITSSCDIYALGEIINEIFTKQNPDGTKFITISQCYPFLSPLDDLVYRCLSQDPIERPSVDAVLNELQLLAGDTEKTLKEIKEDLLIDEDGSGDEETVCKLAEQASLDVLSAKYFFENKSFEELDTYNRNYHASVRYNVDNNLKNIYFQHVVLYYCEHKFRYETQAYKSGNPYHSLNLSKKSDKHLYHTMESALRKHKISEGYYDLSGKILKTFSACCDYHCRELLCLIPRIEEQTQELDDSPILHIVCKLRFMIDMDYANEISLDKHIYLNWENSIYSEEQDDFVFEISDKEEIDILEKFKQVYGISYDKIDAKRYSIKFSNREKYNEFKQFALNLAKPYYVFAGDVLGLLKIRREYMDIVELYPIKSFEITDTIAKILGLRSDY